MKHRIGVTAPRLQDLGLDERWDQSFAAYRAKGLLPARVVIEFGREYLVCSEVGDLAAVAASRLRRGDAPGAPRVGDWVALAYQSGNDKAVIQAVLERRTHIVRKVPGKQTEQQVLAANADGIFIVQSLDETFSARRLERYLVTVYEGGAEAIIVLNKADLCADPEEYRAEARGAAPGAPVIVTSARTGAGMDLLRATIVPPRTYAFAGPSGVGKSALINRLAGEELLATREVRLRDARGRHTTARRELLVLPEGGVLMDTPGMRELQLWEAAEGLAEAFPDVAQLARRCRFRDCAHTGEAGCAVIRAVERGTLASERYDSYVKLSRELQQLRERRDRAARHEKKRPERFAARDLRLELEDAEEEGDEPEDE